MLVVFGSDGSKLLVTQCNVCHVPLATCVSGKVKVIVLVKVKVIVLVKVKGCRVGGSHLNPYHQSLTLALARDPSYCATFTKRRRVACPVVLFL